jgi:superkiller protein 8
MRKANCTQSKQYLTLHTLSDVHPSDIFALAPTAKSVLSASGSSTIHVHDTTQADFPLLQSLEGVHPLGIHHLATARDAQRAASAGFEGKVKIWSEGEDGAWKADGEISGRYALALF